MSLKLNRVEVKSIETALDDGGRSSLHDMSLNDHPGVAASGRALKLLNNELEAWWHSEIERGTDPDAIYQAVPAIALNVCTMILGNLFGDEGLADAMETLAEPLSDGCLEAARVMRERTQ